MSRGAVFTLGIVAADGEKGVRPGQPIAEILARDPAAAPASSATAPAGSSRHGPAIVTGALVLATSGICLFRRRKARAASSGQCGAVEIVGRAALSHKHSVCVVRVGDARIVIGLAGDRMSPLAVLEDSAAPPERASAGRVGRPPVPELPRGRLDPDEMDRYRRQVDRLKDLLRGPLRNAAREIGTSS